MHIEQNKAPITLSPGEPELCQISAHFYQTLHSQKWKNNSPSVLSVAAFIDVLAACGINAVPVPVFLSVYNPTFTELLKTEPRPTGHQVRNEWVPNGAFSTIRGANESPPGRWYGHLVTVVENRTLVDFCVNLVHYPEHNIVLTAPLLGDLPSDDFTTIDTVRDGCVLIYQSRPADRGFEFIPDWEDPTRCAPLVEAVLEKIKQR